MLEKSDLHQIREIIREEVRPIVREEVRPIVKEELVPIKKDIKALRADVSKIKGDINMVIEVFDEKDIELEKRIESVETRVGIVN